MGDSRIMNIIPHNEAQRLEALRRYHIANTSIEESFDNIARIMAEVFKTPIALISLVDKDHVYFKGNAGMNEVKFSDRSDSLCSFAILNNAPTIFDKPLTEPCLLANPLVHGAFGLRFYAGAPLITSDNYNIGSVCIIDKNERSFTNEQQQLLVRFSKLVMNQIELRESVMKQAETENQLQKVNEELQFVTHTVPQLVWASVSDGYSYFFNERWLNYTGLQLEDVKGYGWSQSLHPDDLSATLSAWQKATEKGENYECEYRLKRYDGFYRWFLARATPMKDENGNIVKWYGTSTDIHDQKMAEEALKESEARNRLAIESAHMGTFQVDIEKKKMVYSARAAEIFGFDTAKEWSYQQFIDAIHPDDAIIRLKAHEIALKTGQLLYEARIYLPNKKLRWIRLNGALVTHHNTPFLIGTTLDITEEKEAANVLEQKIEERTTELKQANEKMKQFAYSASHDLQEPLRKISFFIERLLQGIGNSIGEEHRKTAHKIVQTTNRMRILIDDLLDYSNTSVGITRRNKIDLNTVLTEVLDDMEATIIEKKAVVNHQLLPTITGDQRQLKQLFQNLVSNAFKYHKKEDIPVVFISSKVKSRQELAQNAPIDGVADSYHEIEVKDNGIGIAPENAARIFGLFQRLHGKAEYEGTGLGLAIVQQVVENHHGKIWVESAPGEGSVFKLLLPIEN